MLRGLRCSNLPVSPETPLHGVVAVLSYFIIIFFFCNLVTSLSTNLKRIYEERLLKL